MRKAEDRTLMLDASQGRRIKRTRSCEQRPGLLLAALAASSLLAACGGTDPEGGTDCPLPTTFQWTSTGPLAQPPAGFTGLKDFTSVVSNGKHIVYMSTTDTSGTYGSAAAVFSGDWSNFASATLVSLTPRTVAPELFYFAPKAIWILASEWGASPFNYQTSTNPTDATAWSSPASLISGTVEGTAYGPIDHTIICNSETCYLFFAGDNGKIYRSSMPMADFPGAFSNPIVIMSTATANDLFEAVEVYTVKGSTPKYLMIVEAIGASGQRYFRSYTAPRLGDEWTALAATEAAPFAGKNNVTFSNGTAWTSSISHGDLVRTNPDETHTIDPCNLQLLYQGCTDCTGGGGTDAYNKIAWRPGLLTLKR
jgi:alpha-N-arabinofuranosidase